MNNVIKCPKAQARIVPVYRKTLAFAIGVALFNVSVQSAAAPSEYSYGASGNVIGDDVLYRIGGGNAVNMGKLNNMSSISVGAGWNASLVCGNMSLTTTLQNQLNGVTNGFQTIMGDVIQNATAAVASLPALIIQRANPGLYNLLTNGVLQARVDYDRSKATCRAMSERMADVAGNQMGWGQLAEGQAMRDALVSTNSDAVASVVAAENSRGQRGVPWVGGSNAGGEGQQPIRVVEDITRAGYNLLNRRSVTDTAPVGTSDCNDGLVCEVWDSPEIAVAFATRVLGEEVQQTCETCTKTATMPGVGLTPVIQEQYEIKLQGLNELINGSTPLTRENLRNVSSNSVPVTRRLIEALRNEEDQDVLTRRLASEVSMSWVIEQALLLVRVLIAGSREPNVASNDLALTALSKQNNTLQQEIGNLKTELELRRELSGNAPAMIIERSHARRDSSRGVFDGDSLPDRLRAIERQAPGAD